MKEKKSKKEKQFENELLKLKIIGEHGGKVHSFNDIPPDVENVFLKNVLAFEENFNKGISKKIFEILGEPKVIPSDELSDDDLENELEKLFQLMEINLISLDFLAEYPSRLKYDFIVNELFDYDSMPGPFPGMTSCFIYEEFHPNAEYSINGSVDDLITDFFERKLSEYSKLNSKILFEGKEYDKNGFIELGNELFAEYKDFNVSDVQVSNFTSEGNKGSCSISVSFEESSYSSKAPREMRFSMNFSDEYDCDWWGLYKLDMEVVPH